MLPTNMRRPLRSALLLWLLGACGGDAAPPPPPLQPPPAAPLAEPAPPAVALTPDQVRVAIGELVREQEPELRREIEVTFLALMDETVTWRPIRGPYEAQVMREPIARRRQIVDEGRRSFLARLDAIERRTAELLPAGERDAAAGFAQNLQTAYAAYFDTLDLELRQLDAYDEMIRILADSKQTEWSAGKGYFRTLQAGKRHAELEAQVQAHEAEKRRAMERLQSKLVRTGR